MVKYHSDGERVNPLTPVLRTNLFDYQQDIFYMHHPTVTTIHTTTFCYTNCGALVGTRNHPNYPILGANPLPITITPGDGDLRDHVTPVNHQADSLHDLKTSRFKIDEQTRQQTISSDESRIPIYLTRKAYNRTFYFVFVFSLS